MKWFVRCEGSKSEYGPYSASDLRKLKELGKLGPDHLLRPESDQRMTKVPIKARLTDLFWKEGSQGQRSSERLVSIEVGFQFPSEGSFRPADGYGAGFRRVVSTFPIATTICTLLLVGIAFNAVSRQQSRRRQIVEEKRSPIREPMTAPKDLISELGSHIGRWKERRAKAFDVITSLKQDRDGLLQQLQTLGVTTVEDGSRTPRATILLTELKDVLRQLIVIERNHEEYDLAIFKIESRLRTIERRISTKNVGMSEDEVDELTRSVITLNDTLAHEFAHDLPLELDTMLNDALAGDQSQSVEVR